MSVHAVARRYAAALVELAVEENSLDRVAKDLAAVASQLGSSDELQAALANPSFSLHERKKVLEVLITRLGLTKMTSNFLNLLVDKNRIAAFGAIEKAVQERNDALTGRVRAQVSSAVKLDRATIDTLQKHIAKITNKKEVVLTESVDPALVGGIVTQVGDLVLDGSVRTQLRLMRDRLINQDAAAEA